MAVGGWGSGFGVWVSSKKVEFGVWSCWFGVSDLVGVLGFRLEALSMSVWGLRFTVEGLGMGVEMHHKP